MRSDRNIHGGGIAVYIRCDLPHRRRPDIESVVTSPTECLIIEVVLRGEKWLYACVYSPHFKHRLACCNSLEEICKALSYEKTSMLCVLGDMNIDILDQNSSKCIRDVMDVTGLQNMVTGPTCYKSQNPSLIDVILISNAKRISSTFNIRNGLSDFHNIQLNV